MRSAVEVLWIVARLPVALVAMVVARYLPNRRDRNGRQ